MVGTDIDWNGRLAHLGTHGWATLENILDPDTCHTIAAWYEDEARFRSHIVMARHGFGQGEYKYFNSDLPPLIRELRSALYARLAPLANAWNEAMGVAVRFPSDHAEFIERCHAAGQTRPTPLLLRYRAGDYNCMHQDVYGEHLFPMQATFLLAEPERDFNGGEFVLVEQRPRIDRKSTRLNSSHEWI